MHGNHFSLILLSTNQCNAACDYCFEDKTRDRLSLERLQVIADKVLDHMDVHRIGSLTIHWQGGEAMLLPPRWYRQAFALIQDAAAEHGKRVEHGMQTNMLAYGHEWDAVIADMFGNSLSTSLDYPNLHRRVAGRDPEHYDALWAPKVRMARDAGIDVKVISVLNQGTLAMGAKRYYEYFVDELGVTDFQINTPFPGVVHQHDLLMQESALVAKDLYTHAQDFTQIGDAGQMHQTIVRLIWKHDPAAGPRSRE